MTHRFLDKEQRELDEDEDAIVDCFFVFFLPPSCFAQFLNLLSFILIVREVIIFNEGERERSPFDPTNLDKI